MRLRNDKVILRDFIKSDIDERFVRGNLYDGLTFKLNISKFNDK